MSSPYLTAVSGRDLPSRGRQAGRPAVENGLRHL